MVAASFYFHPAKRSEPTVKGEPKAIRLGKDLARNKGGYTSIILDVDDNLPQGMLAVCRGIAKNSTVTYLSIHCMSVDYYLDPSVANALSDSLKSNVTLVKLKLKRLRLYLPDSLMFIDAFRTNAMIQKLDLRGCYLGVKGISALADALDHHSCITELNLNENNESTREEETAQSEGLPTVLHGSLGTSIARIIAKNQLTVLSLQKNRITAEDAVPIAAALKVNQSLQKLDLSFNLFGTLGCQHIFKAIDDQKNLTHLFLRSNDLTGELAPLITDYLSRDRPLKHLGLVDNQFSDESVYSILSALASNTHLNVIDINVTCIIAWGGEERLWSIVQCNHSLVEIVMISWAFGEPFSPEAYPKTEAQLKLNEKNLPLRVSTLFQLLWEQFSPDLFLEPSTSSVAPENRQRGNGLLKFSKALWSKIRKQT